MSAEFCVILNDVKKWIQLLFNNLKINVMKKMFIGLFVAFLALFGEYTQAQQVTATFGITCEKIRFHRPKYECKKGFWICTECKASVTVPVKVFSKIEDVPADEFPAVFSIDKESSTVTLRILRNLAEDPEYSSEDLHVMTVDEDEIEDGTFVFNDEDAAELGCHSFTILPGTYEVTEDEIEGVYYKVVFNVSITE